ncbi:hypothetical protein STBA_53290 [Streptomyces sp. MP131-18]|nr:hypothetical protein STBA_53290 [Streptomyces sp. MP131-18]
MPGRARGPAPRPHSLALAVVPRVLTDLLSDQDPAASGRVMKAMLGMGKLDIQALREAHAG